MPEAQKLREFKFKGQRVYVHGSDFFDSISLFLKARGDGFIKDLTFRLFTEKQCKIHLDTLTTSATKVICQGRWQNIKDGSDTKFWITEMNEAVVNRYGFDEDSLCQGAQINDTRIYRRFNPEFTMIENVVALTKYYHNAQMTLSSGKWVFGQIVLGEELVPKCETIEIDNYHNIKDRFSRNYILLDGRKVGEIRFIVS
jgi:hypothetical protein